LELVSRRRFRAKTALPVLVLGALLVGALTGTPVALSAKNYRFTASYTGKGHGAVKGTHASGSATLVGRGKPIGRSTLRGSARGVFTSRVCIVFSGTDVLKGEAGSLRLSAHQGRACAPGANQNYVSYSGSANVSHGTGMFRGARGTVFFHGTYARHSGAVMISLKGELAYQARRITANSGAGRRCRAYALRCAAPSRLCPLPRR
jgi:hypothetical protein